MSRPQKTTTGVDSYREILTAARKEFADQGFRGARISAIAKAAGVNPAMIYYHFENKETLYSTVMERILSSELDPAFSWLGNETYSETQRLFIIVHLLPICIGTVVAPRYAKIIMHEFHEKGQYHERFREKFFSGMIAKYSKILVDGMAAGEFRDVVVDLTAIVLYDVSVGIFFKQQAHAIPAEAHKKPEDVTPFLIDYIKNNIVKDPKVYDPESLLTAETKILMDQTLEKLSNYAD